MKKTGFILGVLVMLIFLGFVFMNKVSNMVGYRRLSIGLSCFVGIDDARKKIFPEPHKDHVYGIKSNECIDVNYYAYNMIPVEVGLYRFKDEIDNLCVVTKFSETDSRKIERAVSFGGRNRYVMSIDDKPYAVSYLSGGMPREFRICSTKDRAHEIRNDFLLPVVDLHK